MPFEVIETLTTKELRAEKFGLATTPIVKPTTGVAEGTFTENTGGLVVNVDSTVDGYTFQQVVKALRNLGLLA